MAIFNVESNLLPGSGDYAAQYVGKLAGRRVYRVPVRVSLNDSRTCSSRLQPVVEVLAYGAADAANWALGYCRDRPETQVHAWGPKGGHVARYNGWESCIGHSIMEARTGVIHRQNGFLFGDD